MHSITVPDLLYAEAQRVAAVHGLSVEAYVQEALLLHIQEDERIKLAPEQVAIIAKAEADIDAGDSVSAPQMREYFNQKKSVWTQTPA